jgi:hypothetical protein
VGPAVQWLCAGGGAGPLDEGFQGVDGPASADVAQE